VPFPSECMRRRPPSPSVRSQARWLPVGEGRLPSAGLVPTAIVTGVVFGLLATPRLLPPVTWTVTVAVLVTSFGE
jgi:hypothetical protein